MKGALETLGKPDWLCSLRTGILQGATVGWISCFMNNN